MSLFMGVQFRPPLILSLTRVYPLEAFLQSPGLPDPTSAVTDAAVAEFRLTMYQDETPSGAILRLLMEQHGSEGILIAAAQACIARPPEECRRMTTILRSRQEAVRSDQLRTVMGAAPARLEPTAA